MALVDFSRDPIYRFVSVDIRYLRSAPLKVFQQLKTDVFILLSRLVSISVECSEKAVERGLSENPFALWLDFGETHVLNTPYPDRSDEIFKTLHNYLRHRSEVRLLKPHTLANGL